MKKVYVQGDCGQIELDLQCLLEAEALHWRSAIFTGLKSEIYLKLPVMDVVHMVKVI